MKPGPKKKLSADEQLAEQIAQFYADPLGYVMFVFDWENDKEIQQVELQEPWASRYGCRYGPDVWACEFLDDLGAQVLARGFDGSNPVDPLRYSTVSGHGIGKSTISAWITLWIMDTRPNCKGTVTANTAEQLRSKTWAELGKWHQKAITSHLYEYTSTRGSMRLVRKGMEKVNKWVVHGQTCREENSEAFAGQHAIDSTSFYIFDEASGIPDKIFEVREGGLTDGEPMIFDWGNGTVNSGMFFENCVGKFKKEYVTRSIDSRRVAITNKKLLNKWIDTYGIESDFCKVRILGQFPSLGSIQFIPGHTVIQAQERVTVVNRFDPLVIGVDVARFGDDETVLYPRIGADARTWPAERYRGLDTVSVVGRIIEMIRRFGDLGLDVAMTFVDGGGIGGGVVDQLRALGYPVTEVQFGSSPTDKNTYRFKVDEMWGNLREALARNLMIPPSTTELGTDLYSQLTKREFGYTIAGNKINLESKEDMKERLKGDFASPDIADALALTFALPVAQTTRAHGEKARGDRVVDEYDPFASMTAN